MGVTFRLTSGVVETIQKFFGDLDQEKILVLFLKKEDDKIVGYQCWECDEQKYYRFSKKKAVSLKAKYIYAFIQKATENKDYGILFLHNHPVFLPILSKDDYSAFKQLNNALKKQKIDLEQGVGVVAGGKYLTVVFSGSCEKIVGKPFSKIVDDVLL